jgi:hypothetical protein
MAMNTPSTGSSLFAPVSTFAQPHAGDHGRAAAADDLLHRAVPDHLDLRVREQPVLQDLLGAQLSRRWISVTWSAWWVRYSASSTAVLPPPTTATRLPR